jgi:hypothetical protein
MRKPTLLAAAVLVVAAAPATAKLGPNPSDRRLAREFVELVHQKDVKGLRAFLSPAFLLQRADGTWRTKAQYLKDDLPTVETYTITDVHGTRDGDIRVVRFTLQTKQTIDGQLYSQDPVPRLGTYVRHAKTWQLVSYANFNAPAKT